MQLANLDLDLDLDAVDFVRLAFLGAAGGVSIATNVPLPCLNAG